MRLYNLNFSATLISLGLYCTISLAVSLEIDVCFTRLQRVISNINELVLSLIFLRLYNFSTTRHCTVGLCTIVV